MVSEQAMKASLELIEAVFSPSAKSPVAPEEVAGEARADDGARQEQLAAFRDPADGRCVPGRGRRTQEESGVRDAVAQSGGLLPAARIRLSRRRFPHRAGAAHLRCGSDATATRCNAKSIGGSSGDAWRAGSIAISRPTSTSGSPAFLLPRGKQKPQRVNSSLLPRNVARGGSLELLPIGVEDGARRRTGEARQGGRFKESELWCLSRLGARKLFYGPINLVVPPATVTRWVDAVLNFRRRATRWPRWRAAPKTRRAICPRPHAMRCARKLPALPHADRLLAMLEGEEEDDRTLGRIFGEELPSGLVLSEVS